MYGEHHYILLDDKDRFVCFFWTVAALDEYENVRLAIQHSVPEYLDPNMIYQVFEISNGRCFLPLNKEELEDAKV